MALNLTTLAGQLAKVEVTFMGQSTKVTYDPLALTSEAIAKAQSGSTEDFHKFFCELVKSWDVTKSGKKVPLTPTSIKGVPLLLLRACFQTIVGESDTVLEEGKASSAG